ncbi:tRNA lysidine(34) synthetase TilS, partial [Salmonella enterica]|nr:tRNA lysidine(34) synthetase TilS [Salmonella enterica]EGI5641354.1 tRNA lysidine(34) synthetase TilS [Salmonella enterica subsp. enterica serovar Nima]EHO7889246.1 tRNA lysidine(34) synthetase TilS [Salmonella enterica]EIX5867089.1 tRNA lysidine(34) synthetase TilS [Salmonella enterica]HAK8513273.1 tRNA lysidine(34) synthetase TilS [Salmonella enterica]
FRARTNPASDRASTGRKGQKSVKKIVQNCAVLCIYKIN